MQPVYFAHGYREREAHFAAYFAKLMNRTSLLPSLDPPSDDVNAAKLERHLSYTAGLLAVISTRDEGPSPHILFEISMALRAGMPLLVFIEDSLPGDVVPPEVFHRRFSARSYVRETREHLHAMEIFRTYLGQDHTPKYHPSTEQRSCMLIGTGQLGTRYDNAIKSLLEDRGYRFTTAPTGNVRLPLPGAFHAEIRTSSLAVCVLDDSTPASMYFLGAARSSLVPTITLSTNRASRLSEGIPREYQRRIIAKNDIDEGTSILRQQLELFEEDFIEIDREGKAEEYANQLYISASDTGSYSENVRSTIIKELNMGDKYVAGQVGAQGPNAHAHDMQFTQTWNEAASDMDLKILAEELAKLREALKKEASAPDQDAAVGAIANAELAANEGDGPKTLEWLSKAGKWALDHADKIGVAIATAALKAALGL